MINLPPNKKLILFDGLCNLCDASVQYIIRHDTKDVFRFASLQSEIGKEFIKHFSIDTKKTDSILLFSPDQNVSYKSTAALKIASHLGFPRSVLGIFLVVPTFLRNWVYDYIAKNRYRWYGKKDECMVPTPELKSKFL